jgi:hypothetical protein
MLALLGMGLNRYTLAFMNGMQKGQAGYARQMKDQMNLHARELDERTGEMLDEYRRTFAEYGDPADPQSIKDEEGLKRAIEAIAQKYNDTHMLNALHNNGVQGVISQLNAIDGKHSDLKSSRKSQEQEEKRRREEEPWRRDPDAGTTTTPSPLEEPKADEAPWRKEPGAPETPETPAAPAAPEAPAGKSGVGVPITQAEPPAARGPQLAERGDVMSDAPQPGVPGGRVAAADTAPAEAPEEPFRPLPETALRDAAGAGFRNSKMIDDMAHRIAGGAKVPRYEIPDAVRPWVENRVAELNKRLDHVQEWAQTHPNFTGKAALDAIKWADPNFGGALEGYVSGEFPLPGTRNPQLLNKIISFGNIVDPRFNAYTAKTRAELVKKYTSGTEGRNLVSRLTSLDHLESLKELAAKVPYIPGLGAKINRLLQEGLAEGPEALGQIRDYFAGTPGLSEQQRQDLTAYLYELNLIAPEVARAQKGAAPTNFDEASIVKGMTGFPPEILMNNIDKARHLIQQRMREDYGHFQEGMGGPNRKNPHEYDGLFKNFEHGGMSFDPLPAGSTGNQPPPVALRSGRSYGEELTERMKEPTIPEPAPPRPAAPAAPAAPAPAPNAPAATPTERPANVPKDAKQVGGRWMWRDPKTGKLMEAD